MSLRFTLEDPTAFVHTHLERTEERGKQEIFWKKIKKILGNCKQIISLLFQNKQVDAEEGS